MFPTKIAEAIVNTSDLRALFGDKEYAWKDPIAQFQRMGMVSDYDTSFKVLTPHLRTKPDSQQEVALKLIHSLVRDDCLSLAIEQLVNIADNGRMEKDRLAAAAIVNELYGEKELVKEAKLSDKLTINLTGA